MPAVNALSEQQVLTVYVIATFLTLYPMVLVLVGILGLLHRKPAPAE
jgi:hypothetical protein